MHAKRKRKRQTEVAIARTARGWSARWIDPATGKRRRKTLAAKTARGARSEADRLAAAIDAEHPQAGGGQLLPVGHMTAHQIAAALDLDSGDFIAAVIDRVDGCPATPHYDTWCVALADFTAWLADHAEPQQEPE